MAEKNKYSIEEIKRFTELYPVTSNKKMAEIFGCAEKAMKRLAMRLGLHKSEDYHRRAITSIWTEDAEAYMRQNYATAPVEELAKHLKTNAGCIRNKARDLGLKKKRTSYARKLTAKKPTAKAQAKLKQKAEQERKKVAKLLEKPLAQQIRENPEWWRQKVTGNRIPVLLDNKTTVFKKR